MFTYFGVALFLGKRYIGKELGKCKIFHKKIRKNKRKTFQSPIWAFEVLGDKIQGKMSKFRGFIDPSDQNELYQTPSLSNI